MDEGKVKQSITHLLDKLPMRKLRILLLVAHEFAKKP